MPEYSTIVHHIPQTHSPSDVGSARRADHPQAQVPISPPGRWTKFKAALCDIPLIRSAGFAREAKDKVMQYCFGAMLDELAAQKVLTNTRKELHERFDLSNDTRLDSKIDEAFKKAQDIRSREAKVRDPKAETDLRLTLRRAGDQAAVKIATDDYLENKPNEAACEALGLKADQVGCVMQAISQDATEFIYKYVRLLCEAHTDFGKPGFGPTQIEKAIDEAATLVGQIQRAAGNEERANKILGDATNAQSAVDMVNKATTAVATGVVLEAISAWEKEAKNGVELPSEATLKSIKDELIEELKADPRQLLKDAGGKDGRQALVARTTERVKDPIRRLESEAQVLVYAMIESRAGIQPERPNADLAQKLMVQCTRAEALANRIEAIFAPSAHLIRLSESLKMHAGIHLRWLNSLANGSANLFGNAVKALANDPPDLQPLQQIVAKASEQGGTAEHKTNVAVPSPQDVMEIIAGLEDKQLGNLRNGIAAARQSAGRTTGSDLETLLTAIENGASAVYASRITPSPN